MITGLDHATLLVNDFDKASRDYALLLGREPDWQGVYDGARHCWFTFDNTSLKITAPEGDGSKASKVRARIAASGEGLAALAFAVGDLEAVARTLERRGIRMFPIESFIWRASSGKEQRCRFAAARPETTHGIAQVFIERDGEPPRLEHQHNDLRALDHIVIRTSNADRALALYGARLGLDLRLERANAQWGSRIFFFRCGGLVLEIGAPIGSEAGTAPDSFGGLAWRIPDASATHERLAAAGFGLSELRKGRKVGTQVFTVRDRTAGVPTLMIATSEPSGHTA